MAARFEFFRKKDNSALQITFGYESPIHSSVYWLDITRVYFDDDHNVEFAKGYFSFLPDKPFRKSNRLLWFAH